MNYDTKVLRVGPLWFQPGITGWNFVTMCYASFSTISLITFLSFAQPFLLNEVLNMPQDIQGTFTGTLHTLQEIIVIVAAGFIGAWSDRTGRRVVFVAGLLIMAVGYFLYPLATSTFQLIIFRCIFAVGAAMAPVMMSACIVDYIQERSRGRWLGINSIFTGLGAMFMATVLAKTPQMYMDMGNDVEAAARFAFWTATGLCVFAGLLLWLGLNKSKPDAHERPAVIPQLKAGAREGLKNNRLGIAYFAAFIGRGDLVVLSTFFSLWMVQAGQDLGISSGDALARAGMYYGILHGAALLWAPCMGFLVDRVDRVTGLAIALALAAVGYSAMGAVDDPFGSALLPVSIFLGIGEVSVIIAAGTLMGQEAPPKLRGTVVGLYGFMGGLGILFATFVGGIVFDNIARTAPFTMMGILNGVLLIAVIAVRLRNGKKTVATEAA
jgi:MFS family permease